MTDFNDHRRSDDGFDHDDQQLRARVRRATGATPPTPPSVQQIEARLRRGSNAPAQPDFARRRLIAGLAAASVVGLGGFALTRRGKGDVSVSGADVADAPLPTGTPSQPTIAVTPAVSMLEVNIAPTTTVPLTRVIGDGMAGDDVTMIQTRLKELAYDPGEVDGIFGLRTQQASWAFQKLVLGVEQSKTSDEIDNDLWAAMQQHVLVYPRRPELSSTHVEVYLPEQVLVLFESGQPKLITHISSGSGEDWCEVVTIDPGEQGNEQGTEPLEKGICGKSLTTGGTFSFTRKLTAKTDPDGDGWREGSLGRMFQPVYFNYGLAVHGSGLVPKKPASHGCIRTPMHIAEYFPELVNKGDDIWVWDGAQEPEHYGPQQPYFDRRDPDWIPPSTTTSTTTTTTTTPDSTTPATTRPEATVPPTTQPPPAATTTVPAVPTSTTTG